MTITKERKRASKGASETARRALEGTWRALVCKALEGPQSELGGPQKSWDGFKGSWERYRGSWVGLRVSWEGLGG